MNRDKHILVAMILCGFLGAGCAGIASTVSSIPGVSDNVKPAMDIAQKTGEKALDGFRRKSVIPKNTIWAAGLPPVSWPNIP